MALSSTIVSKPRRADGTEAGLASHTKRMLGKFFLKTYLRLKARKGNSQVPKVKREPQMSMVNRILTETEYVLGIKEGF